jgi:L-fuconolactonase
MTVPVTGLTVEARADVRRGLDAVAEAGLAFDVEIGPRELPAAAQVAASHPDLRFVPDHLGKPPIAAGGPGEWRRGFAGVAACGNVWCKLSGLVTEAAWTAWTVADLVPYVREAVERFGVSRLLSGSDWPVSADWPGGRSAAPTEVSPAYQPRRHQ